MAFRKILVPIDGSENANRSAKVAAEMANLHGSELVVLYVIAVPSFLVSDVSELASSTIEFQEYYDYLESIGKKYVEKILSQARKQGARVRGEVIRASKSIVDTILEFASREEVDLIIIGTRGLGGFKKLLLGSVSSGVAGHAHCSVLIIK